MTATKRRATRRETLKPRGRSPHAQGCAPRRRGMNRPRPGASRHEARGDPHEARQLRGDPHLLAISLRGEGNRVNGRVSLGEALVTGIHHLFVLQVCRAPVNTTTGRCAALPLRRPSMRRGTHILQILRFNRRIYKMTATTQNSADHQINVSQAGNMNRPRFLARHQNLPILQVSSRHCGWPTHRTVDACDYRR
jgi:hypothetical protein